MVVLFDMIEQCSETIRWKVLKRFANQIWDMLQVHYKQCKLASKYNEKKRLLNFTFNKFLSPL